MKSLIFSSKLTISLFRQKDPLEKTPLHFGKIEILPKGLTQKTKDPPSKVKKKS